MPMKHLSEESLKISEKLKDKFKNIKRKSFD